MGRKYLEVLTAKTILGIRKKAHHERQNQKAFWGGGCEVRSLQLSSDLPTPPHTPVPQL